MGQRFTTLSATQPRRAASLPGSVVPGATSAVGGKGAAGPDGAQWRRRSPCRRRARRYPDPDSCALVPS